MKNMLINELAAAVNVVDSIIITTEYDTSIVLAEWIAYDPEITVNSDLKSAQAVRLFINFSDKGGTIDLKQGDYFTFVIPDIFRYDLINNVTDAEIKNNGEVVATYSIYDNNNNQKEVKITFTDFVDSHTDISGVFWALLFVGNVTSTEQKTIEFVINDSLVAQGEVTINPGTSQIVPRDRKVGFSLPSRSAGGFYIFEWLVYINMEEDPVNGFKTLENFSFEDVIPSNSPHMFLTDAIRQQLGISPMAYTPEIGEYTGADDYLPEDRYKLFLYQYNSIGADTWYNFINWNPLVNGLTTTGIDGNGGLEVSNIQLSDKIFSANLGRVTRPVVIRFFTVADIELTESALGDIEVVSLFKNIFMGNYGEDLNSNLYVYFFGSGGSAQGVVGNYSFSFTKVNQSGEVLPNAMFSLFASEDFSAGADRFVFSDSNGIVTFRNLPAGTFYVVETQSPFGYIQNDTVYKVVLTSEGFEIYYGNNFENKLSDNNNLIVNKSEFEVNPVSIKLTGTKNLTGKSLSGGMFQFVVKNEEGATVATGINDYAGNIVFSEIEFDSPGIYSFTVEEIKGNSGDIIYDGSKFNVIVTVTDDGSGNLSAEINYPFGEIVFNNSYKIPVKKPKKCCARLTKCRTSIEGYKIWIDNNNSNKTRPDNIEIILLRNGEVYKRMHVDSKGNWAFAFCCLPKSDNAGNIYNYLIDEPIVPEGYTKTIERNNIINTLITRK